MSFQQLPWVFIMLLPALAVGSQAILAIIYWDKRETARVKNGAVWCVAGACIAGLFWLLAYSLHDLVFNLHQQHLKQGMTLAWVVAGCFAAVGIALIGMRFELLSLSELSYALKSVAALQYANALTVAMLSLYMLAMRNDSTVWATTSIVVAAGASGAYCQALMRHAMAVMRQRHVKAGLKKFTSEVK